MQRRFGLHSQLEQDAEVTGHTQQTQADHQHAGDGATAEGHGQGCVQPAARSLGGTQVGTHGNIHADVAGQAGKHGPDDKTQRGLPAQCHGDDNREHDANDADRGVLAIEVGACALLYGGGDFLHARVALWLL